MTRFWFALASITFVCSENTDINLLVLVPWPDGLGSLPGARVAVQQVNSRADMLPGYRINIIEAGHEACGITDYSLGLLNLVNFGINRARERNVAAVLGLYCSASTAELSSIASREEIELLQLSNANSPIFSQNRNQYPHLWRFVQSASVYADMMIYLMDQYDWNRLAIACNQGSIYHTGIAEALVKKLKLNDKQKVYYGSLIELAFTEEVLEGLRDEQARVIFVTAETQQIVDLLCAAYDKGMLYPNYLWVIPDKTLDSLLSQSTCGDSLLHSLEGSVLFSFNLIPENKTSTLKPANISYNDFLEEYYEELKAVNKDYAHWTSANNNSALEFAALLYDQVWAFSLALNNSLPYLISRNLSLLDYRCGDQATNVTIVIEQHLRNLSFRGASGHIKFNELQEVSTQALIKQVANGASTVNLNFSDLQDEVPKRLLAIQSIIMGISSFLIFLLTTVVFTLMLKYRNETIVKALSPKLSILIFLGCYSLIIANVFESFALLFHTLTSFFVFCSFKYLFILNGLILIYVTLFFQLNRIYRIFYNEKLQRLGWIYDNQAIILQTTIFVVIPNMMYVASIITEINIRSSLASITIINVCYAVKAKINGLFFLVYAIFFIFLGTRIIYIALKINEISNYKNFDKAKITVIFVVLSLVMYLVANILRESINVLYAATVDFVSLSLVVLCCLLLLFIPTLFSVLRNKLCG